MVGFWCPAYVAGINVPGFHLHFLTKDGKSGGHVLDFTAQTAIVKLDLTNDFTMILPSSPAFYEMDFTANE
jgi:acetolactate decarboxylase